MIIITNITCCLQLFLRNSVRNIYLKGLVHPKMKILSVFTHPQVVPNLYVFICSAVHKGRYLEECFNQTDLMSDRIFIFGWTKPLRKSVTRKKIIFFSIKCLHHQIELTHADPGSVKLVSLKCSTPRCVSAVTAVYTKQCN